MVAGFGAGLQVFEISGSATPALMRRATALDLSSLSAPLLFAIITTVVFRYRYADTIRVNVDRAGDEYVDMVSGHHADDVEQGLTPAKKKGRPQRSGQFHAR
ncbi:hypothetical protein [Mesorhizobium onobrychidis]|uniref:Uncharacterized protein n=1 Tax=Mesorhizobium onobrychidis TaxID=2775404 RepID=A0ABY5R589_9HYPH|nr:hypothetical protein [Mesorhizobium onobrychidis]UVC17994.1 hypothetical protein IHQ72_13445 [Mesorhizobium onobrychidis]